MALGVFQHSRGTIDRANSLSPAQTFKNPKPALLALLRESGPVPGDENGVKSKRAATGEEGSKKKKRTEKSVSDVSTSEEEKSY